ncbi:glycosyltransferase family 4 protein [Jatrophihabitans sp. YIM 134969]
MRLLVDGRVLDDRYHGIGRITSALLPELARAADVDLVVALRPGQISTRFDVPALTTGLGAEVVHFAPSLSSPAQYLAWPAALRRARADVALFPYNLGAALSGRATRYAIVHDCILESDPRFAPDARTRALYRLLTSAVVRRTRVITPSHASARDVERYHHVTVPPGRVLTWGIEDTFRTDTGARPTVDGRPLPERYFLHVGARRPHKNVRVLVETLARLGPEEHLVLVGSVDARFDDPVPDLVERLGVGDRVVHLPFVSDDELAGLYAGATAFLYPSLIEGVGLPLLEAMAAGTPVVASDIPVFREVGRDAALFVPAERPDEWAAAVRRLGEPGVREGLVARGHALADGASWARTGEDLVRILQGR